MDSLVVLLDRLEALMRSAGGAPLTHRKLVDQGEALALIRGIRERLPREMAEGARLREEGEALLRRAQDEARAVLEEAGRRAQVLTAEHAARRHAEAQALEIVARAGAEAAETRRGADAYAIESLERLEIQARRILTEIERGKALLEAPAPRAQVDRQGG